MATLNADFALLANENDASRGGIAANDLAGLLTQFEEATNNSVDDMVIPSASFKTKRSILMRAKSAGNSPAVTPPATPPPFNPRQNIYITKRMGQKSLLVKNPPGPSQYTIVAPVSTTVSSSVVVPSPTLSSQPPSSSAVYIVKPRPQSGNVSQHSPAASKAKETKYRHISPSSVFIKPSPDANKGRPTLPTLPLFMTSDPSITTHKLDEGPSGLNSGAAMGKAIVISASNSSPLTIQPAHSQPGGIQMLTVPVIDSNPSQVKKKISYAQYIAKTKSATPTTNPSASANANLVKPTVISVSNASSPTVLASQNSEKRPITSGGSLLLQSMLINPSTSMMGTKLTSTSILSQMKSPLISTKSSETKIQTGSSSKSLQKDISPIVNVKTSNQQKIMILSPHTSKAPQIMKNVRTISNASQSSNIIQTSNAHQTTVIVPQITPTTFNVPQTTTHLNAPQRSSNVSQTTSARLIAPKTSLNTLPTVLKAPQIISARFDAPPKTSLITLPTASNALQTTATKLNAPKTALNIPPTALNAPQRSSNALQTTATRLNAPKTALNVPPTALNAPQRSSNAIQTTATRLIAPKTALNVPQTTATRLNAPKTTTALNAPQRTLNAPKISINLLKTSFNAPSSNMPKNLNTPPASNVHQRADVPQMPNCPQKSSDAPHSANTLQTSSNVPTPLNSPQISNISQSCSDAAPTLKYCKTTSSIPQTSNVPPTNSNNPPQTSTVVGVKIERSELNEHAYCSSSSTGNVSTQGISVSPQEDVKSSSPEPSSVCNERETDNCATGVEMKSINEFVFVEGEFEVDANGNDVLNPQVSTSPTIENDNASFSKAVSFANAQSTSRRGRRYRRRAEFSISPIREDKNNFFDKIPAHYTVLSIPSKQMKMTAFESTTKSIGSMDHLELSKMPEVSIADGHYDKVPAFRSIFTNTTKDLDVPEEEPGPSGQAVTNEEIIRSSRRSSSRFSHRSRSSHRSGSRNSSHARSRSGDSFSRSPDSRRGRPRSRTGRSQRSSSHVSNCSSMSSSSGSYCSTCDLRSTSRSCSRSCSSGRSFSRSRSRSPGQERDREMRRRRRLRSYSPAGFRSRSRSQSFSPHRQRPTRSAHHRRRSRSAERRLSERRTEKEAEKRRAMEERRVVYVGKIPEGYTKYQLRKRFEGFGEIKAVKINFREHGDNYGFITYTYSCDAIAAKEKGNNIPGEQKFDLCFGGRRHFCPDQYADLDGNREIEEEYSPMPKRPAEELDYAALLKQHQTQQKKRR